MTERARGVVVVAPQTVHDQRATDPGMRKVQQHGGGCAFTVTTGEHRQTVAPAAGSGSRIRDPSAGPPTLAGTRVGGAL